MSISETINEITESGLIAIVRGQFTVNQLLAIGNTLTSAGISVLEVTLNTSDALKAIERLSTELDGSATVGAGTVRTVDQLQAAIDAGAQFTVAPNYDPHTVDVALDHDFLHLPGVFTPSEAESAYRAGCRLLKLFPSDIVGPGYLKAVRAPLDDIQFVPTGGISADNIQSYRQAGAVACGIGSALITGPDQSMDDLDSRAQTLLQAWQGAV